MATPDTGFQIPTLPVLIDRISSDLNTNLPGNDSRIRRSVLWALARVLAGAVFLCYGFVKSISRQILPDTATGRYLDRLAGIWGITRKLATAAKGNATFAGVAGTIIPIHTIVQRVDLQQYKTDAQGVVGGGGTVLVACTAVVAGAAGNSAPATALQLVSPIAGLQSAATVDGGGLTTGTDDETDVQLQVRVIARISNPPQGGALTDYVQWAEATPGVNVRGVYVSPLELGAGTVTVRFSVAGTGAAVIPNAGQITAVIAQIDPLRPVTAEVHVVAPIGSPIDFNLHVVPNTADVQTTTTAELAALFARLGAPGTTIKNSVLRAAISNAAGQTSNVVNSINAGNPNADVVQDSSHLAYLGTVTYS